MRMPKLQRPSMDRPAPEKQPVLGDFNRRSRRSMGIRVPIGRGQSLTFVPRYLRRHYKEVIPVAFTWRTVPGRRERKVTARIARARARYDLG